MSLKQVNESKKLLFRQQNFMSKILFVYSITSATYFSFKINPSLGLVVYGFILKPEHLAKVI
jgi:hypothetical protein